MATLMDAIMGNLASPEYIRMLNQGGLPEQEEQSWLQRQANLNASDVLGGRQPRGIEQALNTINTIKTVSQLTPSSTAAAPAVGTAGAANPLGPYIGAAAMGGALASFGSAFNRSRERRKELADLDNHRQAADTAWRKAVNNLQNNITKDLGFDNNRIIGQVTADQFNKNNPKANVSWEDLRTWGFDANKEALSDLLFEGKYTYGKWRKASNEVFPNYSSSDLRQNYTITLDQFLEAAPPQLADTINRFYNSPNFQKIKNEITELKGIKETLAQPLSANNDIGIPSLVEEFLNMADKDMMEKYRF